MNDRPSSFSAFTLVEVTIAIGVAGFSLIAICGLIPVGLQSSRGAIEQTSANGILSSVAADLRATPPASAASDRFQVSIPALPTETTETTLFFNAEGKITASANDADSRYRMKVRFIAAADDRYPYQALLRISWPTLPTDQDAAEGDVTLFMAFTPDP